MTLPSRVHIRELGPREGFQILKRVVPTERKLELIRSLVDAGLTSIEVASMVRPDRVPQMADAEDVIRQLPSKAGVEFTALYLNIKGFQRAESAGGVTNLGWLYSSPSNSFLKANSNSSIEESIGASGDWIAAFRASGKELHGLMVSTAFGCAYEGTISYAQVVNLIERIREECSRSNATLKEICLADTVGMANPESIRGLVQAVRDVGFVDVSLHLHDTWGLGMANVYAGLLAGVSVFETSIGGMGGCPFTPGAAGNVATEDVVYLCNSLGVGCDANFERCCKAAELAESIIGETLPGCTYKIARRTRAAMLDRKG